MKTDEFDFILPESLIAQKPISKRDESKLMIVDRKNGKIEHTRFSNIIDYLEKGDILVLNDTKVIPARLYGAKQGTNAAIEILLLNNISEDTWKCLVKHAKRIKKDDIITFGDGLLKAKCMEVEEEGIRKIKQANLNQTLKEMTKLNLLLQDLDIKIDTNLNILNNEYSMTYERAREEYQDDLDIEESRGEVEEIKKVLKSIGMVNLEAIEEYEEVNKRYTYLTKERDDLMHAKDMLYSIIEEMDEVMQSDFLKTFQELEKEFKKVFKELFRGGDASLKLTDPNNLLETGVEIEASPPGKKLKTVTLLSGGEKTLTAISLLFAILNIRSVPFCIFDEVEAALDEANVDNFGEYLSHYQDKTQFLLITHKKRTMEYAKTLYGITMQESGVSKLVSVKLEDNLV